MNGNTNDSTFQEIREGLIEALGRITSFWGFSRVMGQIYGLLYLSPRPLSLTEISQSLSISKGNVSINVRALERWNMVKQVWVKGDRKDYYEAETDFWNIIRGVLREREKKEFAQALNSISMLLGKVDKGKRAKKREEISFIHERLTKLLDFIKLMDNIVTILLKIDDIKGGFLLKR